MISILQVGDEALAVANQKTIRLADTNDCEAIAELLAAAFADYRPFYTAQAFAVTTPGAEEIVRRIREGPIWVAQEEGRIIGTVSVLMDDDGVYIRSMAVHPQCAGRGVGTRLLEAVEQQAIAARRRRLYLCSALFLHAALRLYRRFGFRELQENAGDLFGTPLIGMEKRLY